MGAVFRASFTITVTDTVTGESKEYVNPSGTFGSIGHVRQCLGCMKAIREAYAEWSGRDPDEPGFEGDALAELRSRGTWSPTVAADDPATG